MAKIRIKRAIEALDHKLKRALEAAVEETIPEADVDRDRLFRAFVSAVERKTSTWEEVPDDLVKE